MNTITGQTPYYHSRCFLVIFFFIALSIALPLIHSGILTSIDDDLAHHVRHIYEYKLALLEGQFPPLVAPELNGSLRIPLFQYYSGTAYIFPALISLSGIDEYTAMKFTIFIFSFLGALSLYQGFKIILKDTQSAFVGALTFQLFTFPFIDLYVRGGFVEWISLQYSAFVFFSLLNIVQHIYFHNLHHLFLKFLLSIITLILFIPCHPIQTLYNGIVMGVIIVAYIFSLPMSRSKYLLCLNTILSVAILSTLLTSWFWLPILQDYHSIKITKHAGFFSAGTNFLNILYPWFHTTLMSSWALQIGFHVTLSILILCLCWKKINPFIKTIILTVLIIFFLVISPTYFENSYILWLLFHPVQWSYRFLITIALVSSLAVGIAQHKLKSFLHHTHHQSLLVISTLLIIINAIPYLYSVIHLANYSKTITSIKAPDFIAYNSMGSYSLSGTNYSALGWIIDGKLQLNKSINLPHEGIPFETEMTFEAPFKLAIFVGNHHPVNFSSRIDHSHMIIRFTVTPPVGLSIAPSYIIFQSNVYSARVIDYQFRAVGDKEWYKIPLSYDVNHGIAVAEKTAYYQLPICYFPNLKTYVNNILTPHPFTDKFLIITKLYAGKNTITTQDSESTIIKFLSCLALGIIVILAILSLRNSRSLA